MPKSISPDALALTVSNILNEYSELCEDELEDAVKTVTKNAKNKLKTAGSFTDRSGDYRKGWAVQIDKKRLGIEGVVYQKKAPGLAHLLEFGHAKQKGGRTKAFPHIAPVNEEAQTEIVQELERKLSK